MSGRVYFNFSISATGHYDKEEQKEEQKEEVSIEEAKGFYHFGGRIPPDPRDKIKSAIKEHYLKYLKMDQFDVCDIFVWQIIPASLLYKGDDDAQCIFHYIEYPQPLRKHTRKTYSRSKNSVQSVNSVNSVNSA